MFPYIRDVNFPDNAGGDSDSDKTAPRSIPNHFPEHHPYAISRDLFSVLFSGYSMLILLGNIRNHT